ncbi:bifunctional indole-3-glycerol-phosphate synthase TrpC/phosphoribosylanthranilate isomerase TrpF [Buchnera aphidicola]|uniref:Multifunctional fusion protein n=1 Tax=Buchnera aphidicola (Anoecia oenotherae) TaxID=1241833 RepID=A0A4D6XXZ6_9GAMM|nr:bifunctional indole-3-glycerol-phosphate synthase TrpC/phosphoribosylanthranilate isomerase TrpF [Buchnera aphidicola]QCI19344.1 bifunctional indole-3-glycerol-phosphate synthase TrpC/phosphoribosylanthranilate isomerase TrpF [Buchnera aphidicola (Anoecia oenotherae)]
MQKNLLKEIIHNKKKWIKQRQLRQPLTQFKNFVVPSNKNFEESLKKHHPFFILECKKSSPTCGILNSNFNLHSILNEYKTYATAISILTDEQYFQGKFEYLLQASQLVHQPILSKDFFIDPYQVFLARYYKADAILLMLSILNDHQYAILSKIAKKLNMGIITEINNTEELNRANYLKANIIGINNRNLKNLSVDIQKTITIAPLISKKKIIISESGISTYKEVRSLSKIVNGFLIGSSLIKSTNLNQKIKSIIFGKNKICGLTNKKDAISSYKVGAIYGGLIFEKSSVRYVSKNLAYNIIQSANLKYIAVFQDEPIFNLISLIKNLPIFAIQLHGNETQDYIDTLYKHLPHGIKIWKAVSVSTTITSKISFKHVTRYVLDNGKGGTGKTFNWSYLKNIDLSNIIIAGGLNEKNCFSASKLGCSGLDFNSGIEKTAGIKDEKKMISIFKKLRYYQ